MNREEVREIVRATFEAHRRDPDQHDVWLPNVRCVCGRVMGSNRFRGHIADQITAAVVAYHLGVKPCERCHRPTRPIGRSEEEAPGTVPRGTKTLCMACYARDHRRGLRHPKSNTPTVKDSACARCGIPRTAYANALCRDCGDVLTEQERAAWVVS